MDEQVLQLFADFNAKLATLAPKMLGSVAARDPQKVNELKMLLTGFSSNLMFYGIWRKNDAALRASNYFSNIAMDAVKWEEFVNMIYGPA